MIGPTTCVLPAIPTITGVNSQGGLMALDNGNILITKPGNTFYETNGVSSTSLQTLSVGTVQADRLKLCEVRYPTAYATVSNSSICANTAITLGSSATSITEASPTYTYSWTSVPAEFTSSSQNPSVTPSTAGNYRYIVTVTNNVGCTDTASVYVTVDACTGVGENSVEKAELKIFPNPTTGLIILNDEFTLNNNFEVMVCNSYGEIIIQQKNSKFIDITGYANGIYYLTVKTDDKNIMKKVILIK